MPPLDKLPPARLSFAAQTWMFVLRAYLVRGRRSRFGADRGAGRWLQLKAPMSHEPLLGSWLRRGRISPWNAHAGLLCRHKSFTERMKYVETEPNSQR